jgi:hypothetical protein
MAKKHTTRCAGCKAFHKPNIEVCPRCGLELNGGADNGKIGDGTKEDTSEESTSEEITGPPAQDTSADKDRSAAEDRNDEDGKNAAAGGSAKNSSWSFL